MRQIEIDLSVAPHVLFVGNGALRLGKSMSWNDLLQKIAIQSDQECCLDNVPMAMQPECLCGVDVDEVQRRTAAAITESEPDASCYLKRLVSLPFDAILTTNYTYEIEQELSGKPWTEKARRNAFVSLDKHSHVRSNTCICNLVTKEDGTMVPVFHIHGEKMRKHSMILSYYSYANSVSRLIMLNKNRGNTYQEKQDMNESISCQSWLDYFIMGNVYSVGFGFDTSEFDVWWAIERKAREKAKHGVLHAYMIDDYESNTPQKVLFHAMDVELHQYTVKDSYLDIYEQIRCEIEKSIGRQQ